MHEFHGIFERVFDHAHLPPVGDAPNLCQMKGLMEMHKCGKFHQYTICGSQVMNIEIFSDQPKIPFWGAFEWFFGHNSPTWSQIFSKFRTVMETIILHHIYYGF